MKRFSLSAVTGATVIIASLASGCKDDEGSDSAPLPEAVFDSSFTVTPCSVSFSVKVSDADEAAWTILERTAPVPDAAEVLASGRRLSGSGTFEVTADGLNPLAEYTAFAVAARGELVSETAALHFATDGYTDMLTVLGGGKNFISYHVEVGENVSYRHLALLEAAYDNYLDAFGGDPVQTATMLLQLYGSDAAGPQDLTIRDLQENPNIEWKPYDIVAGMPHVVMVRAADASGALAGDCEIVRYTTDAPETLPQTVRVDIVDVNPVEAEIMCTPDEGLLYHYEQVYPRGFAMSIIAGGGVEALLTQLFVSGSRILEPGSPSEWVNLTPGKEYVHYAVGVDADGNRTELVETPFATPKGAEIDTENIAFSFLYSSEYYGKKEDAEGGLSCNYYFIISDVPMTPDEYGEPFPDAFPCNALNCDIYATVLPGGRLVIPEGTYTFSETFRAGTWHPEYTWAMHFDEYMETQFTFVYGTIAVAHEGEGYRLDIALKTDTGKTYSGTFTGEIPFAESPAHSSAALRNKAPFSAFRVRPAR